MSRFKIYAYNSDTNLLYIERQPQEWIYENLTYEEAARRIWMWTNKLQESIQLEFPQGKEIYRNDHLPFQHCSLGWKHISLIQLTELDIQKLLNLIVER